MSDNLWTGSLYTLDGTTIPIVEAGQEDLWLTQALFAFEAACTEDKHEREVALRTADRFRELAEGLS